MNARPDDGATPSRDRRERSVARWVAAAAVAVALLVFSFRYGDVAECLGVGALDGRHVAALEVLLHPGLVFATLVYLLFSFDANSLLAGIRKAGTHVLRPRPLAEKVLDGDEARHLVVVTLLLILHAVSIHAALDVYGRVDRQMRSTESSAYVLDRCERDGVSLETWGLATR